MSETSSGTKRVRAGKATVDGATPTRRARTKRETSEAALPTLTSEQRRAMIAERAYLRAEQRGFQGGDPVEDWLVSEREVDALLTRTS